MKKRVKNIIFLSLLTTMTAVGAVSSSLAWFFDSARVAPTDFMGSSQGAYFAYGTGQKGDPYGINKPRHLYNLAWLNMMGYFDIYNKGTNGVVYFEIDPELDGVLDGAYQKNDSTVKTVIPPIGTVKHPFYGNFNGNGKIITNFVVSADNADYGTMRPYNYTEYYDENNPPQIVGLFGVVGTIDGASTHTYDSQANQIYNLGLTNLQINTKAQESLVGIVAGYVNGKISDVAVNTSAITVNAATTGALTEYTTNISDYGIIGHCTMNYTEVEEEIANLEEGEDEPYYDSKDAYKTYAKIYDVNTIPGEEPFNAHARGKQVGAGSSIEMKTMYNNLAEIWDECIANENQYRAKYISGNVKVIQSQNGSEEVLEEGTLTNEYSYWNSGETATSRTRSNGYHSYFNDSQTYDNKTTASYSLVIENASNAYGTSYSYQNDRKYMCITGKKEVPVNNQTYTKQTIYNYNPNTYTGNYIYWQESSETYHYLTYDSSAGFDTTVKDNAPFWALDNSNHLVSVEDDYMTSHYLQCASGGALSIVETAPSNTWTYNATTHNYTTVVSGTTYYLGFDGSTWKTTTYNNSTDEYYLIHSGDNYMSHPATSGNVDVVTSTSRPNGAEVKWYLDTSNRFTTTKNGSYYLRRNGNNNNSRRAYYSNSTSNVFTYSGTTNEGDNTGSYLISGYYYPRYSASGNYRWPLSTTASNLTFTRVILQPGYVDDIHCGSIYRSTESTTVEQYRSQTTNETCKAQTQDTYFPLRRDEDNSSKVDDANTGYVVGGANYDTDKYGDIRVSAFDVSDLSASYTSGSDDFTNVYTIDGGTTGTGNATQKSINLETGAVSNSSRSFTRFTNVKSQMIDTLKNDNSDNKIYGLHFMNAAISKNNTIFAPWVKVRNKSEKDLIGNEVAYSVYENYEMPEDSIDFHFGENGIITFIAGSYYQANQNNASTRNNCFFSFHQIERYTNAAEAQTAGKKVNDIKDIKEIRYVYENSDSNTKADYPYVYEYVGGARSTGTVAANAPVLFNTDWIKNTGTSNLTLTQNAAYYFEIPAIKGEYALGSIYAADGNKRGAYLMYLDLGANGNRISRTTVNEHFEVTKEVYDYPLGVQFASTVSSSEAGFTVDPLDSANFVIKPGYTGQLTITRSSNSVTAVSTDTSSSNVANLGAGYYSTELTVTDGGSPAKAIKGIPKLSIVENHERIQLLDYGINYLILTQTVVERVTTNVYEYGVLDDEQTTISTTIKQYAYNANNQLIPAKTFTTPGQEGSIVVYDPDDPTDPGAPYANPKTDILALYSNEKEDVIFEIRIPSDQTTTIVIDAEIIRSALDEDYHYEVDGYNVIVSVTGSTVTVTVVNKDSSYTFKINGNVVTGDTVDVSQPTQGGGGGN